MDIKNEQSMEQVILETAERLFLEKGFASTSTTEIAREVGCNQALIHYYFRTKDNLFNTIFEQKFKQFFHELFEINNADDMTFQEKLKHIIESHFDLLLKNPRLPLLILNELSRQPEQVAILREKLHSFPEKLFTKLNKELAVEIENGRIREINVVDLIITTVSINISLFVMMPIVEKVIPLNETQKNFMLAHRRSENVDFILKSLRP
jgi:AcrR family transcriptional regulator